MSDLWMNLTPKRRARQAARHQAMPSPADFGLKLGDIFVNSWGYEQTNIDFYEVTGMTAASVRLRPIDKVYDETGFMSGTSVPIPGKYIGSEFIKRLYEFRGRPHVNMPYGSCRLWDGQPMYESHYA